MAYAIPVIQDLQSQQPKIQRHDGPVAMVIVPTREVRFVFTYQSVIRSLCHCVILKTNSCL